MANKAKRRLSGAILALIAGNIYADDAATRAAIRQTIFRENPFLNQALGKVSGFGNPASAAIANHMYSRTYVPALQDAARLLRVEPHGLGTWVLRFPWVNVVVFETTAGLVLVDSGYAPAGPALLTTLRQLSSRRLHTIIYTHHHIDHMLGAWALLQAGERPEIIATRTLLDEVDSDLRTRVLTARLNNQTLAEFPHSRADLPMPTRTFYGEMTINIGEDQFVLHHAPGETADQLWVAVPTRNVVVAADYFQPFLPNAGNGKRRQRFVDSWARALRDMAALKPARAFPMHGPPLTDTNEIVERFTSQARMLESIAEQTLAGLNSGRRKYEVVESVTLPPDLAGSKDAQAIYTTPKDISRMVAQQYSGWWNDLPSEWSPASRAAQARETVALAGGVGKLLARAQSLAADNIALACNLADLAWLADPDNPTVLHIATQIYLQRLKDHAIPTQEALEYVEHLVTLRVALAGQTHAVAAPVVAPATGKLDLREQLAYQIGTLAYLWGYPLVDLTRQMHNETHFVSPDQPVAAPVNHFYRHSALITPATAGELRAPNNDTLYFGGWFDLSLEPIVVQVPDTADRYYTLAITDFFNAVTHLGRRTTGTSARAFALTGPGWQGALPPELTPVRLATRQVWILGRLYVAGPRDLRQARALLSRFRSTPLSAWQRQHPPAVPAIAHADRLDPMASVQFFTILNTWLRQNPTPAEETSLLGLFDQIGVGPRNVFDANALDDATRRGLQRALAEGQALLRASSQQRMSDVRNGWIFPLGLADYGQDYLLRASVAFGGYANRPEETVYAARVSDAAGQPMTGAQEYRLHFSASELPPAGAFWSLTAYDRHSFKLMENSARRYSIGDRTPGLRWNADGSLDIYIQRRPPQPSRQANWLPVSDGPYSLILRIYEPGASVLDGRYQPPGLQKLR